MHYSASSDPLIYAFLLRREEFQGVERLIVETREQGEKLLKTLEALQEIQSTKYKVQNGGSQKLYRLISTPIDLLEVMYDETLVGIFPVETLDWKVDKKDISQYCLELEKDMIYNEEKLISWLSDHGYRARKSDEIGTYFRAGDTVSLPTNKGIVRVSFFGTKIEDIFLGDISITSLRIYSLNSALPVAQIS